MINNIYFNIKMSISQEDYDNMDYRSRWYYKHKRPDLLKNVDVSKKSGRPRKYATKEEAYNAKLLMEKERIKNKRNLLIQ